MERGTITMVSTKEQLWCTDPFQPPLESKICASSQPKLRVLGLNYMGYTKG